MKSIRSLHRGLALFGLTAAVFGTTAARANLSYSVDLNLLSLVGNSSAPFSLDVQSNYGSGPGNTVTLSNVVFTGGSATGSATLNGGVTGGLSSSLVFNDSAAQPYNEFYQAISAGTTNIKFNVNLTTNAAGITPTSFSVAILDNNLMNIPTSDPSFGDTLVLASINGSQTTIASYMSTGATGGVTASLTTIPEPSTAAALFGSAAVVAVLLRRRQKSAAAIA